MSVVEVARVSHGYGRGADRLEALHDVSLTGNEGELVCLSGPSGSGKSSLCHLVAGLESPDTGTVNVLGTPAADVRDWALVAVVPQQHGLLAELTVEQNVSLPAYRAGVTWDGGQDLFFSLDIIEFADRPAAETSLGEPQRTAIARAFVLSPRVVVLDEPTGHQDDHHVEQVLKAMRSAAQGGTLVLVASHDERVLEVADRVLRLDQGRMV